MTDPASILREAETIAVVGLSDDPKKASHDVAGYLKEQGYRVIPVNPYEEEVFGERAYDAVDQVSEHIDVVDVFLPSEKTPAIAEAAVQVGAGTLWLQLGITSLEARRIAEEGGLAYVEDKCTKQVHQGLS